MKEIKAVIFDMDGVLIDSEPLWRRAMIQGFQEIGIPFTDADCRVTTGMRFKEVVEFWFQRFDVRAVTPDYFNLQVIHHMADLIRAEGRAMEGVYDSLDFLAERSYKIGLATSSSNLLLEVILEKLAIRPFFHQTLSAEFLQYGKPHPEVFLNCAHSMGIAPRACLVVEDSLNGVIAAKAAQMQVVAIPEVETRNNPKFQIADHSLKIVKRVSRHFPIARNMAVNSIFTTQMKFTLLHTDPASKARAGTLETDHGIIETPIFMPVGTAGTVKAVHQRELKEDIQAQIILGNTYHLYLRPGLEVLENAGGLHKFNGWDRPILTDSGGYQIFSLAHKRKLTEEGAKFTSHIDGSKHMFTPESVMDIERTIGADIIMAFDECTPYPCEYSYAKKSLGLTHRWLDRCVERFRTTDPKYGYAQSLFPIVQGSVFKDLRIQSAEYIASKGCDGNAIGGLSVGEPAEDMYAMTEVVTAILPTDKPRYLMGVGTPANILESIALGIDMFDCVMPTRNARHGLLFTRQGIINIKNEKWKNDFSPIDPESDCYVDQAYSKAYLRHLLTCNEILAAQIASIHNLAFYLWLVKEARRQILAGTFADWKNRMVKQVSQRL